MNIMGHHLSAFYSRILVFKVLRKKADKSFYESQSDIQHKETLKSDTVSLLGELVELLMPKFAMQPKVLQAKQRELDNFPFNTSAKNVHAKETFESIRSSFKYTKSLIADIGLENIGR